MKLTDLNIDCLEAILEHLELKDLLNVADSNKRLCHASKFVYIEKYGSYIIRFCRINKSKQKLIHNESVRMFEDMIDIDYLKCIFQLLRNFGHLISQIYYLMWFVYSVEEEIPHIIDYLDYYCRQTLDYIFISVMKKDQLNSFKNPFTNVKTLEINSIQYTQKHSLIRLFPKVEKLIFTWNDYKYIRESIANHFPYLASVEIASEYPNRDVTCSKDRCVKNFKAFLQLNPQLKHLYMQCGSKTEIEILQWFDELQQNIKCLKLLDYHQFFKYSNGKEINLNHVEHLSIKRYSREQTMCEIPILCEKLISFQIEIDEQSSKHIYKFYQNNSTIRKLTLGFSAIDDFNVNYTRLLQFLPFLEEITSYYGKLSVDEAYHVLTLFKSLKYFRFFCIEKFDLKKLESYLNAEWSIQFTKNTNIILKRKI